MKHTLALLLVTLPLSLSVAACGKKNKVKECDDFIALAEKIAKCDKIPEAQRKTIGNSAKPLKDALKQLEDFGADAPKEQLEMVGKMCQRQSDAVRAEIEKVAPDCVK